MMTMEEFGKLPKDQQDAIMKEVERITKAQGVQSTLPQLTMKEFEDRIADMFSKQLKSMTEVDKKYFAFPGIGKDKELLNDTTPMGKFAKTRLFFKALVRGDNETLHRLSDEVRQKAAYANESTGSEGAFLVPEEFSAEVLRLMPDYGVARRECRIMPMQYDVLNLPVNTANASAHWTNEASQIYGTKPVFAQVILTIKKLATIPKVTNELLKDANVDVMNFIAMTIAESFAKAEDEQCFSGTGSPFTGALNATGVPTYALGNTSMQSLSYSDLAKIPDKLYASALANAKFYFHRSHRGHMRGLITSAGAPIMPNVAIDSIFGYPIVATEALPGIASANDLTANSTYAIFGNFRLGMLMGERGTLEMKMTDVGVVGADNLFEKDMSALRVIERVTFGCALPSAFIKIQTASA